MKDLRDNNGVEDREGTQSVLFDVLRHKQNLAKSIYRRQFAGPTQKQPDLLSYPRK